MLPDYYSYSCFWRVLTPTVIALFKNFDRLVDLIAVTIVPPPASLKFETNIILPTLGQIMLGSFTVTTCNLFTIAIHYTLL